MRTAHWTHRVAPLVAVCTAALGQQSEITEFGPDGTLTWITGGTDAVYRIEWASSLTGEWKSDWSGMRNIPSKAGETITVGVPMFFRVVGTTGLVWSAEEPTTDMGDLPEIGALTSSRRLAEEVAPPLSRAPADGRVRETTAGLANDGAVVRPLRGVSPTEGLIAWYNFDRGTAEDSSGYGNDGIPHAVLPAPDRRGTADSAMYFNGENAWIEVKSSALYDQLHEVTLALWLRPLDDGRGRVEQNLISKQPSGWLSSQHGPATSNHGGLFDLNLYMEDGVGQVYFCTQVHAGMTSQGHVARMNPLPAGHWQHLAVSVSRAENRIRVYVNGVKADDVVCKDYTHIGHLLSQPNTEPLRIGKRKDADFGRRYFCGWMDDVRIYNRALSDNEIVLLVGR